MWLMRWKSYFRFWFCRADFRKRLEVTCWLYDIIVVHMGTKWEQRKWKEWNLTLNLDIIHLFDALPCNFLLNINSYKPLILSFWRKKGYVCLCCSLYPFMLDFKVYWQFRMRYLLPAIFELRSQINFENLKKR